MRHLKGFAYAATIAAIFIIPAQAGNIIDTEAHRQYQAGLTGSINAHFAQSAARWLNAASNYFRAANLAHPDAMVKLAELHLQGKGVARDPEMAMLWLRRAARLGNVRAMSLLAVRLDKDLRYSARDKSEAARWYLEAYRGGARLAMIDLHLAPRAVSRSTRIAIQRRLIGLGLLSGEAHGGFGPATMQALVAYANRI